MERIYGPNLAKIIAMLFIVLDHVVLSLSVPYPGIHFDTNYLIDIKHATVDLSILIISLMRYGGALGNNIFFVASAWFLIERLTINRKKLFKILINVWIISVLFLLGTLLIRKGAIPFIYIVKSLLPTFFQNNWYITLYIIFYPLSRYLNIIIMNINEKEHKVIAAIMFGCFSIISFIYPFPYFSVLLLWISYYFVISYIKKYRVQWCNSFNVNICLMFLSVFVIVLMLVVTNFLGLKYNIFYNKLLYWDSNQNPFIFIMAFTMFNLLYKLKTTSKCILKFTEIVSSLTIYIYLIHENILFREFFRPLVWQKIYNELSYKYIYIYIYSHLRFCYLL